MITLRGKLTRKLVERKAPPDLQPLTTNAQQGASSLTTADGGQQVPINTQTNVDGTSITNTTNNTTNTNATNDVSNPTTNLDTPSTTALASTNNNNQQTQTQTNNLVEEWTWSGLWAFGDLIDEGTTSNTYTKEDEEKEDKLEEKLEGKTEDTEDVNVVGTKEDKGDNKQAEESKEETSSLIKNNSAESILDVANLDGGGDSTNIGDDKKVNAVGLKVGNDAPVVHLDNTKSDINDVINEDGEGANKGECVSTAAVDPVNNNPVQTGETNPSTESTSPATTTETLPQEQQQPKKKRGRQKGWKKKTPEQVAAEEAATIAAAEADAAKPRPFTYKWIKNVDASNVIVPSALVIMVKEGDLNDRVSPEKKVSIVGDDGVEGGGDKSSGAAEGQADKKIEDGDKSGDVVMAEASSKVAPAVSGDVKKDGDGDAVMGDASTASDSKLPSIDTTAATSTGTTKPPSPGSSSSSSPSKLKFKECKNIQTYGGSPFTDASTKYSQVCPKSGKWEGHFENVGAPGSTRGRPSLKKKKNHIRELFYLFFNATPPTNARGEFDDSDTTIKANELLDEKGSTNVDDAKKEGGDKKPLLPESFIHVRGYGTNRFGTFEIIGSLDPETGILSCQRMYVPVPSNGEITKVTGGTQRHPTGRFLDLAIHDEEKDRRTSQSRKRKSTWKKLGHQTDDFIIGLDGVPVMVPGAEGIDGKRRRRSTGGGGDMASIVKNKRSRQSTDNTASAKAAAAPGTVILKAPPQCKGPDNSQAPAIAPTPKSSGGGKRSKKGKKSKGSSAAAGQPIPASYKGPLTIAPPPSVVPTLPTAGDPLLARWRSAHYLYYQRVEMDPEGEGGASWGATTTTNQPRADSGEINPDLIKINYVIYEGEMTDGVRHGQGVCLYNNNTLYEGQWKKNKEHGVGKLMTADRKRVIYEGTWEKGKMHGQGTYYYYLEQSDGTFKENGRYAGHFRRGAREGMGIYTLPCGSIYDGEFHDNIQNGYGIFRFTDGSIYEGAWKDGKRHGNTGILVASDGFRYEGQWVNNSMEGRGVATYPKGQVYDGTWVAGKREGRGTIRFTNGAVYEGRFKEDRMEGQGTMKMSRNVTINKPKQDDGDTEMAEAADGEADKKHDWMIPLQFQSDISHIHLRAGFTNVGE